MIEPVAKKECPRLATMAFGCSVEQCLRIFLLVAKSLAGQRKKKAAGRLCELRRSLFSGACD